VFCFSILTVEFGLFIKNIFFCYNKEKYHTSQTKRQAESFKWQSKEG